MENIKEKTCPYCGAKVNSEICPYCGGQINISSDELSESYERLYYKSCPTELASIVKTIGCCIGFSIFGFIFAFCMLESEDSKAIFAIVMGFAFCLLGLIGVITCIKTLIISILTDKQGVIVNGTVCGYGNSSTNNKDVDSNPTCREAGANFLKILIDLDDGKYFVLYDTGSANKIFKINSNVEVKIYKDYIRIVPKKVILNI